MSFTNEIEILLIQLFFLLALNPAPLLLLAAFAVFHVVGIFFLVFVDNETFADLPAMQISAAIGDSREQASIPF
jgi:hypothetical protein